MDRKIEFKSFHLKTISWVNVTIYRRNRPLRNFNVRVGIKGGDYVIPYYDKTGQLRYEYIYITDDTLGEVLKEHVGWIYEGAEKRDLGNLRLKRGQQFNMEDGELFLTTYKGEGEAVGKEMVMIIEKFITLVGKKCCSYGGFIKKDIKKVEVGRVFSGISVENRNGISKRRYEVFEIR